MKEQYAIFANNLKQFMNTNHMNQRELSIKLDVSTASVCDWVNGNKMPRIEILEKISQLFNCSVSELFQELSVDFAVELDGKKTFFIIEKLSKQGQSELYKYAQFLLEKEKMDKIV